MSTEVMDGVGNVLARWDDVTRTFSDFTTDPATVRPYTDEENERADAEAAQVRANVNETTLQARASSALAGNLGFLAIQSPTNAQTLAQVRALTRQVNALIRLEVRALDTTEGTL